MPLPSNGFRHLVIPTDSDGNAVAVIFDGSVYRLAVDALIAGPVVIGAVELDNGGGGGQRAQILPDGSAFNAAPNDGSLLIAGQDDTGPTHRNLRVNAAGELIVSQGTASPGATVTGAADTPVGGAGVALPAPPAGTSRATYQNITPGTVIRIHEVGGVGGPHLPYLGIISFGGEDGAIAPMEADLVSGPASSVATIFEGP